MPDECLNYEKVMKYILAGAGLMIVAYMIFKYQSRNQTSLASLKISELEQEIHSMKEQLNLTNQYLSNQRVHPIYPAQSTIQPLIQTPVQETSNQATASMSASQAQKGTRTSKEEDVARQQMFGMW